MAYVPLDDDAFRPLIAGNASTWQSLIDNDAEVFENYAPGFEVHPRATAYSAEQQFRLRWWGNLDNDNLIIGVRATASSPTQPVTVVTSAVDSGSLSVGADGWYSDTLAAQGPTQEIVVTATPAAGNMAVQAIRIGTTPGTPTTARYPSGWRLINDLWYGTGSGGSGINSGVVSRLRTNPARLAIVRPVCVFAHCADTQRAVTAKALDLWGAYNSTTTYSRVGRGLVPNVEPGDRWFRVDAYVNEDTPGTASYSVRIGGATETWQGAGWRSWRVKLGPDMHELWGNILPGAQGAAIRTLQVWRTEL